MNFLVLSSSRGTTFQAVIDAARRGELTPKCLGLICDRADRGCVAKAKAAKLPVKIIEKKANEPREEYDRRLHGAIVELGANPPPQPIPHRERGASASEPGGGSIIACIGWMFLLSPWFVRTWKDRILNVHPSLLPKYPGAHAITDALSAKESVTGMTIHWIDEGLDNGKIIVQKSCSIKADDTEESLKEKVQMLEKEWYPKVLEMIEQKK